MQVASYLDDIAFTHDHARGYHITMHSPVSVRLVHNQYQVDDSPATPFARESTQTLAQALTATGDALSESVQVNSTDPFSQNRPGRRQRQPVRCSGSAGLGAAKGSSLQSSGPCSAIHQYGLCLSLLHANRARRAAIRSERSAPSGAFLQRKDNLSRCQTRARTSRVRRTRYAAGPARGQECAHSHYVQAGKLPYGN